MAKGPLVINWVYKNKKDERGIVIKNKARLVAQGYTKEERIDYDQVFALVSRIEAIRLFLAYASFKDFVVYQMDVKSAFLYGKIEEEVYVCQPPGFEDPDFPDRVCKVEKALYGLHQAPRAWYETLSTYLLDNGFQRGKIDKTLFIRRDKGDILLVQVYVDDIIFGSTTKSLCIEFEKMMHKKFQMSSMGELTFFLGLQKQKEDGIFISQDKYVTKILKKFHFTDVKTANTPMETHKPSLKDAYCEDVDEHLYRSMIGSLMYLTSSRPDIILISWQCKKQTEVANSTTEAEYIAASNCCGQSTICIVKNPVFHSKTKHIEIRHHFIRDSNEKKLIQMIKIHTYQNVADLLTKAFDVSRFQYLIAMDGKKIVITESTIKRDLHLEDAEGIDCLPTTTIFEELTRMGAKTTAWNEFSSTMASAIICLATNQKINFSKYIFDNMVKNLEGGVKFLMRTSKQGRKIANIDADIEVTLIDKSQGRNDDLVFDTGVFDGEEVFAKIDADYQMAQQLQIEEQEQLSIKEKSRLFVQLLEARKKHFGFKFEVIKDMFDKAFKRVNTYVDYKIELMEESLKKAKAKKESSSKRAGDELESDKSKKQKLDEKVEE
ncbi:putative ribonuclease H-like domain-containing protein [Tanacetum coccineum]